MKIKKHKLLLYEFTSKRMRNKLLLLWIVLLAFTLFDTFVPMTGDLWFILWGILPLLFALWIYYAFLIRRAALIVTPKYMILQGPLTAVKISYGRVATVTSSHMNQQFDLKSLKGRQKFLVKPLYHYPCGFIELNSLPKKLGKSRHLWFSPFLFSPRRAGLLLVVDDWMKLSRDVEDARHRWREARGLQDKDDNRSLAARILDY